MKFNRKAIKSIIHDMEQLLDEDPKYMKYIGVEGPYIVEVKSFEEGTGTVVWSENPTTTLETYSSWSWAFPGHRHNWEEVDSLPEVDPYAELKAAHAAGKVIQINCLEAYWDDIKGSPTWTCNVPKYRIKPEVDPYAELKAAHAAGKVIQTNWTTGGWDDNDHPTWSENLEYRIKPEPESVQHARRVIKYQRTHTGATVHLAELVIREHES